MPADASPTTTTNRPDRLAGVGTLVRFLLRRDRIKLPAWTGGLGLFVVYLAAALPSVAATEAELRSATQLFADPVGRLLIGPGYGLDEPSFERLVANGYGLYFAIIAALMNILLVVRHTRLEEQTGRSELIRANVVGRAAPLTATLIVAVITNLVAAVVVGVAMVGIGGFATTGSIVFAMGLAATGMAFAGVATVTAQLSQYPRAAAGMAGGVLGAAFLVRAGGDMAAEGGTALSWLSPLAWAQQTAPFVLDRWWPLALSIAFAVAAIVLGHLLAARRDLGASLVATRPGAHEASARLGTPLGLAVRLQRGNMIGWGLALAIGGLAFGAYTDALTDAFLDLPGAFTDLFGADDLVDGYLAYMANFMAFLGGAYAVTAVQSLRGEETSGRAEPLLAAPVGRTTWLATNVLVTTVGVVAIMAVTGLATGLGAALVTGEIHHISDLALAHLNQVPAVWIVLGIAVLFLGVLPRAVAGAWTIVAYGLVVGTFGPMLDLPEAVLDISPFAHPAEVPTEPVRALPLLLLTAIAAGAAAIGLLTFRRRDLETT